MTDFKTYLGFSNLGSWPANSQLFVGEQQIDGTWAFKSLTANKYIRADKNRLTINYQSYVGPWERWYMESHAKHVHIQSAAFSKFFWVTIQGTLKLQTGVVSEYIVEHWPRLTYGWNW